MDVGYTMKREYELMLVMNPALGQEDGLGAKARVKDMIGEEGGEITSEDDWGTRRLAYTIKRAGQDYMEGNYQILRFNMEADAVSALEGQLRLFENVLRHMVIREPPSKKKIIETAVNSEKTIPQDEQNIKTHDDVAANGGQENDSEMQSSEHETQNIDDKQVKESMSDSVRQETSGITNEELDGQSENTESKSDSDSDSE